MKRAFVFIAMVLVMLLLLTWNIMTGSMGITSDDTIIWQIRLPRILAALILGGALAMAGYLLQTFFHNPIAGPYVLGVSSGAKLMVALLMIFFLSKGIYLSAFAMVLAAFAGALLSMGIVLLISTRIRSMSILIVCGIMIGYICSAITDFCITFADDSNIVNLHNWSLGSFSGMNWRDVGVMAVIVFLCFVVCMLLSKPISAFRMGEVYAANMGVSVKTLRVGMILLSSLLAGCVTAFAGPISFVGIAVPHLVKILMRSTKAIIMIPACFLGGAIVTLFCDGIARSVFAPTEISISSVTAVLLVPVVLAMMLGRHRDV